MDIILTAILILICAASLYIFEILDTFLIISAVMIVLFLIAVLLRKRERNNRIQTCRYILIKEIDIYQETLEPAWEYPNPDDQWIFGEWVDEYLRTEYNLLFVFDDNSYKETVGLRRVPKAALQKQRCDLDYDETKQTLKRRW